VYRTRREEDEGYSMEMLGKAQVSDLEPISAIERVGKTEQEEQEAGSCQHPGISVTRCIEVRRNDSFGLAFEGAW
jgi:hypothetical protein